MTEPAIAGSTMRVFVSEYICGGAWPEKTLDHSLAIEGRAMLTALVEDLLCVPELKVVTTWDKRLAEFPVQQCSRLSIIEVSSPTDEESEFKRQCDECDVAIIVAPEFHEILTERIETASSLTMVAGCDAASTTLCSDKLALARFLNDAGISTIPTERFVMSRGENTDGTRRTEFPCVIKPQDGAGSILTRKVSSSAELDMLSRQLQTNRESFQFVRQPFIEGIAISCAAVVTRKQSGRSSYPNVDVWPPCQQITSDDGHFSYQGADYPGQLTPADTARIQDTVRQCCSVIKGLNGYVGFDLLIPNQQSANPIVVEINPRLTTGYLLWRQICSDNPAVRILNSCVTVDWIHDEPQCWKPTPCSIRVNSLLDQTTFRADEQLPVQQLSQNDRKP